jgi:asparagine synthase (glutamine-hydrolysing)
MGMVIAVLSKKGKNAAETAVTMLRKLKPTGSEGYGIASPTVINLEESIDALRNQNIDSQVLIGYAFSRILARDRPQPLKLKNATLVFDGRIYPATLEISDAEIIAKKLQQNGGKAAEHLVKEADGDFVFVMAEAERLVAGRDVMGARPLYYGENRDFAALASERKALWEIGIENADSFRPGCIASVDRSGFKFAVAKELGYPELKRLSMRDASEKLQTLLQRSVRERTSDLKECAVAFSGGLDSSLIASVAKKLGIKTCLIHVSLENRMETEHAKKVAERLELPIYSYSFSEADVQRVLPSVLRLIETPDPVQTSIGIPVYWAAEKAAEMKFHVMLAGQGADELFGGYRRYVDDYIRYGSQKVQEAMYNDIVQMHKTNFERDSKICNFHNIELRLPFATYQIAKFAMGLPLTLRMSSESDTLRKLVLRRVARNIGLPQLIVNRPKKAIQYATGVNKTLKQFARKEKLSLNEYLHKTFRAVFDGMTSFE